ncbi:hypothetical protein [Mycobacterium sp.]|uniref:hypothetical protein n=1 Tax=Mycobacterium sp. TaxID=1785 RepID=UPI003D11E23D
MSPTLSEREATAQRGRLAVFGGIVLWQVVGAAAGAISYAAEAGGFELEMRRAALRSELRRR